MTIHETNNKMEKLTVRELIKKLLEFDMNARISVDCNFSEVLLEDEGLQLRELKSSKSLEGEWAVLVMEKTSL
jgi:hypothetical protein